MPALSSTPLRGCLLLAALLTAGAAGAPPASAVTSGAAITLDDPGRLHAGPVDLRGAVNGAGPSEITTVVYAVDVSPSTSYPRYADCNGDGKMLATSSTDTEVGPDDLNGDHVRGDVLDCQIGAVDALNAGLAAAPHSSDSLRVGVEAFADTGAFAPLDPAGRTLAAPGELGPDGSTLLHSAVTAMGRGAITRYANLPVGVHTNFDAAVAAAQATFASAPAGPKWLMLLSDGKASVAPETLAGLTALGVRVRTFAVGKDASCAADSALARIAVATGQGCTLTLSPSQLAANIAGSQPDDVAGVQVRVGAKAVAATIDPIGNWHARLTLPRGTYTASATATLKSGATAATSRTFAVAAALPPATRLRVARPAPTLAALPATVRGTLVRTRGTARISGISILLQGRKNARSPWKTVARGKVTRSSYALRWKPRSGVAQLRVAYATQHGLAGAAAAVPAPLISACRSTGRAAVRSVTCRTAYANGSRATLKIGTKVLRRTTVVRGRVTVKAPGKLTRYVLTVTPKKGRGAGIRL